MHGARYLDIRPAYYSGSSDPFWVNHDFIAQNPLVEILHQVRKFVLKTNESVVLGFKEFPHGKLKSLSQCIIPPSFRYSLGYFLTIFMFPFFLFNQ